MSKMHSFALFLKLEKKLSLSALGFLLFCGSNYRFIDEKLREQGDFFYMKNFTYQFFNKEANTEFSLEAEEAFLPSKRGLELSSEHIIAYNFTFHQYAKKKLLLQLKAKRGELQETQQKLFLEGEVSYEDKEGRKLASEKIEYDLKSQTLNSAHTAQLEQAGLRSICKKGVRIDLLRKEQYCRDPYIKRERLFVRH